MAEERPKRVGRPVRGPEGQSIFPFEIGDTMPEHPRPLTAADWLDMMTTLGWTEYAMDGWITELRWVSIADARKRLLPDG